MQDPGAAEPVTIPRQSSRDDNRWRKNRVQAPHEFAAVHAQSVGEDEDSAQGRISESFRKKFTRQEGVGNAVEVRSRGSQFRPFEFRHGDHQTVIKDACSENLA